MARYLYCLSQHILHFILATGILIGKKDSHTIRVSGGGRAAGLITYWELREATTLLELAVWKSNLNDDTEQTAEMRQRRRQECGTDIHIIMNCVLEFFDYNNED